MTLAVDHSRYLTLDTITVTLTNHSGARIYLPGLAYVSMSGVRMGGMPCLLNEVDYPTAEGSHAFIGCDWSPSGCGGRGVGQGYPVPAVGVVAAGETVVLDSYDGQESYPPLSPGAYSFSVEYSSTPVHGSWQSVLPDAVTTLMTPPVAVASAWWIPPWYHQPHCSSILPM